MRSLGILGHGKLQGFHFGFFGRNMENNEGRLLAAKICIHVFRFSRPGEHKKEKVVMKSCIIHPADSISIVSIYIGSLICKCIPEKPQIITQPSQMRRLIADSIL